MFSDSSFGFRFLGTTSLELSGDRGEGGAEIGAEGGHGDDGGDRDEGGDESIFDGGDAGFVSKEGADGLHDVLRFVFSFRSF